MAKGQYRSITAEVLNKNSNILGGIFHRGMTTPPSPLQRKSIKKFVQLFRKVEIQKKCNFWAEKVGILKICQRVPNINI
jgi:hypothetical protein